MAIHRPDFGDGEGRAVVPAQPINLDTVRPGEIIDGETMLASVQAQPQRSPASQATGLDPELVKDMTHSADGYDAQLESMKHSAERILDSVGNRDAFTRHFDSLSPSIQTKAYRALMRNPGASLVDVMDRVEPQLTLAEAYEATQWVRGLKGIVR
jgi:hypothetical protein